MTKTDNVAFFAYSDTFDGKKLAGRVRIIISAKKITDPRTHSTTWDHNDQKVAKFLGGTCVTDDKETIDFLTTYNERNPRAKFFITKEKLQANGKSMIPDVIEKKVIPASFIKNLDITAIKKILKEEFNHATKFDTMKDIIEEGLSLGYFV